MKKCLAVAGLMAAAAAVAVPLILTAPGKAKKGQKTAFTGRNFAHRGLHSEDRTVPENSLEAFKQARDAGYGMELDVQLSRDGEVVVFHDDTLDRVCGVEGRVEEQDCSRLKELSLCGTEEKIPLLGEVLELVNGSVPLIVELKNGKRNQELCEKTYALLSGYKGEYCIESFNPFIVGWFRRNAPEVLRGQLATVYGDYEGIGKGKALLLSRCLLNIVSRPHFIAYRIGPRPFLVHLSEAMGAMKVGYTSRVEENEIGRDAVIFEFYRPRLKYK
ncbi:MAG: glycerophosphodiester phosphodiesterase [Oscillospiraceae bacterium]|nr:glycerophosphodiester phosphodiesterase [Oscillospiraceae bacterium]